MSRLAQSLRPHTCDQAACGLGIAQVQRHDCALILDARGPLLAAADDAHHDAALPNGALQSCQLSQLRMRLARRQRLESRKQQQSAMQVACDVTVRFRLSSVS